MSKLYVEQISVDAKLPVKTTTDAACYDLHAYLSGRTVKYWAFDENECLIHRFFSSAWVLSPGERALIPTGLKMCCDPGYRIAIYPRSGLAVKQGLSLINCVGIIDADYRDEVMIAVVNHSNCEIIINHGDRLAQLAIEPVLNIDMQVGTLPDTDSNRDGGFGSSGV